MLPVWKYRADLMRGHEEAEALFSIHHVKTGESANVYWPDDYSEDNPVYLVKGTDKNGKEYDRY